MRATGGPSDMTAAPQNDPVESDSPPSTGDVAGPHRHQWVHDVEDGPFGPVRRHPFTVVVAAAGATTATLIGVKLARERRKSAKGYLRAVKRQRKAAAKQLAGARDSVASAAAELPGQGRRAVHRLTHR